MIAQLHRLPGGRFRRILHPTRFSALDAGVFEIACALARDSDAELIVTHVANAEVLYRCQDYRAGIEQRLEVLQSSQPELCISTVIVSGPAASEIGALSRDLACDLLVMRESTPGWISGRWIESLSQRVKRMAPCPAVCVSKAGSYGWKHENGRLGAFHRDAADAPLQETVWGQVP